MRPALRLIVLLLIVLSGCAAPQPFSVKYEAYTGQAYPAKTADSPILLDPALFSYRQYTKIGRLSVSGSAQIRVAQATFDRAVEAFLLEAKAKGADGIADLRTDKGGYVFNSYVPGYTTYSPTTTYYQGTVYGRNSATYTGTSTTNVPVYHPGYQVQQTMGTFLISGDLIVFLDKDTSGYVGITIDRMAQNVSGLRISAVVDGSDAARAGLMAGDTVISIDGEPVRDDVDFYRRTSKIDAVIPLRYLRGNKEYEAAVIPQMAYYGWPLTVDPNTRP